MAKRKNTKKTNKYYIGVDLGGTKLLAVLFDERFRPVICVKERVEVNRGEKVFFDLLVHTIYSLLEEAEVNRKQVRAIGMGCPGMLQNPAGAVKLCPNISFLKEYPLRMKLERRFKIPVRLENDVNAGLLGEQQFGAARGYDNVFGIFLGTGVGGAIVINGELYTGATGGAGEIGHTFLGVPSILEGRDSFPTVESMTGRLRIASEAGLLTLKQKAKALYRDVGNDIKRIKSKALLRSIQKGDTAVDELIFNKAQIVGIAMANVVNLLNPQMIVLGGGLMEAMGSYILPVARDTMKFHAMPPLVKGVRVVASELGDEAVAYGGAWLAQQAYYDRKRS